MSPAAKWCHNSSIKASAGPSTSYEILFPHSGPLESSPGCDRGPASPTIPNPLVSQATLTLLLDHLRLVSSFHAHNRMTPQNLAVCFGPVLLPARQSPARPRIRSSGPGLTNAVDFKRHIEVLHYLLQAWPGEPAPGPHRQSRPGRRSGAFPSGQSESRASGMPRPLTE